MKQLIYLGYYDLLDNKEENRYYVLSAVNKMNYICSAINRAGWNIKIVSASGTMNNRMCKGGTVSVSDHCELKRLFSIGRKSAILRKIDIILMRLQLVLFFLFCVNKDSTVLVYHSLGYSKIIRTLKRIKHFNLILEVEEIYSDVSGNAREKKEEFRLFRCADTYLFSTELLDGKINFDKKPHVVVYGTYQIESDRNTKKSILEDGVHCIYAGTFDPRKGGVQMAIGAAESLNDRYHVHILGFGASEQVELVKNKIACMAAGIKSQLLYDGLLSGEEYIRFLQSCHVGLSTQSMEGNFNETSFPSKVLSYLANGLRVVTVRLKVLEQCSFSNLLYYYDEDTPEAIARAIESIDFDTEYDSRAVVSELDQAFVCALREMLDKT